MSTCNTEHEVLASVLTFGLVIGLAVSYIPQHVKIIAAGQSEGFSPWFLLLGATSSTSAMLNMYTVQWQVIKCCKQVNALNCIESMGGIFQVTLQWAFFSLIFILFLIYYPQHKKYVRVNAYPGVHPVLTSVRTEEWRLSVVLGWVTLAHFVLSVIYTAFLVLSTNLQPGEAYPTPQVKLWATFLGVTSAAGAVIQYLPQLKRTYYAGIVGAISIPMMLVQSPGAIVMVVSIAIREGTDWTSWAMYAASGIMQGCLLIMCLVWKQRQRRLGIDDFGNPVFKQHGASSTVVADHHTATVSPRASVEELGGEQVTEETPLITAGNGKGQAGGKSWWQVWKS